MAPTMDPEMFEDIHEAVYLETCKIIVQAEMEGFEFPYTLELYQEGPGSLVSSCIAESQKSVGHWNLGAINADALDQPLMITLWSGNDKKAKLSRTFRIADHYSEPERLEDGGIASIE